MSINSTELNASKKIFQETSKFNPSAIISLYEFDFREFGISRDNLELATISFDGSISSPYNALSNIDTPAGVLRFHNLNINLENISCELDNPSLFGQIIWQGKRYIPFPIFIEGFEMVAKGTLPKPKLTFTNQVQISQYDYFFRRVKNTIKSIGDIIGVSVKRRRTFLKYLDAVNFKSGGGIINDDNFTIDPDPYAELPQDIYYVDRKTRENKNILEYELSSILDIENIKLPLRTLYSEACTFEYRGEGCSYLEGTDIYGNIKNSGAPVATDKDENISELISPTTISAGSPLAWTKNDPPLSYSKGKYVYVEINGIKYYFVSKINNNIYSPFDTNYWIADQCSKRLKGCRKRFDGTLSDRGLPFGGFPATNKD
jgi:lambda family phage minor tail protein L